MVNSYPSDSPESSTPCPHCHASAGFDQREKPPHLGLYCRSCGRWVKWIRRTEAQTQSAKPTPPALTIRSDPSAPACPCGEISRLVRALTGIERELTVVTRALMGVRP